MHLPVRLAAIAAAAAVVAVVGANLFPSPAPAIVGAPATASPIATATASPSSSTSSEAGSSQALPFDSVIRPGRYHIDVALQHFAPAGEPVSIGSARVTFDLPAGWGSLEGWGVIKWQGQPTEVAMAPFVVERVFLDPCHSLGADARGELTEAARSHTLDGLAEAFSVGWSADARFAPTSPSASTPLTTTFAGWPARAIRVVAPDDLELTSCDGGAYDLWQDPKGTRRHMSIPGEINRLWLVEAASTTPGGRRGILVIDAATYPGATSADLAELDAILDSIEIEVLP